MQQTNRNYIRRRVWVCIGIAATGWLLIAVSMAISGGGPPPTRVVVVGFLMFAGAALWSQWGIKCPKCSTRLGQVAMLIGAHWGKKRRLNFCPYCGVSLDEPRVTQKPATQPAPFNPIR